MHPMQLRLRAAASPTGDDAGHHPFRCHRRRGRCRALGVLKMTDDGSGGAKVIAVPIERDYTDVQEKDPVRSTTWKSCA
jgi:hypothetical protein